MGEKESYSRAEYELAITKMRARYLGILALVVITWQVAIYCVSSEQFVDELSLAATVSSIILSVLAIIMSISGNKTMNEIEVRLGDTASKMNTSSNKATEINDSLIKNIAKQEDIFIKFEERLGTIIQKIDSVKESTDKFYNSRTDFLLDDTDKDAKELLNEEKARRFFSALLAESVSEGGRRSLRAAWNFEKEKSGEDIVYLEHFVKYMNEKGITSSKTINFTWGIVWCTNVLGIEEYYSDDIMPDEKRAKSKKEKLEKEEG
ncbi:MAG: hypothetical protein PUJ55_12130 [Clostridiales bacterium]|nr:hypothetical protein [Roseburia sp.]MDD7637668.1 hypothetical protein [Clostridiales bacterium]MDY4112836.1 hypothetical protein [Roseburia sp.]